MNRLLGGLLAALAIATGLYTHANWGLMSCGNAAMVLFIGVLAGTALYLVRSERAGMFFKGRFMSFSPNVAGVAMGLFLGALLILSMAAVAKIRPIYGTVTIGNTNDFISFYGHVTTNQQTSVACTNGAALATVILDVEMIRSNLLNVGIVK
jgi:hypothetical protein